MVDPCAGTLYTHLSEADAPARKHTGARTQPLRYKNRTPLPLEIEAEVITRLHGLFTPLPGIVIADQVSEPNCGVITDRVRLALSELARANSDTIVLADSRERIGEFRDVMLKPNIREATRATGLTDLAAAGRELRRRTHRPVIVTHGDQQACTYSSWKASSISRPFLSLGPLILWVRETVPWRDWSRHFARAAHWPSQPCGQSGASLTIQQLGETGTATRAQILARFKAAGFCPNWSVSASASTSARWKSGHLGDPHPHFDWSGESMLLSRKKSCVFKVWFKWFNQSLMPVTLR